MLGEWIDKIQKSGPGQFAVQLLHRYFAHDVGRQGAALAYYLLFSVFPFLIFLSSLLGLLDLDISAILQAVERILPSGVLKLLESYLEHVSRTSSSAMLWFGLIFSVWFPTRAANSLINSVRRAYHLPHPKNQVQYGIKVLLYTMCLLMAIALTLGLMTAGRRVLQIICIALGLPQEWIRIWSVLRFGVLGVVVFAAVGLLYAVAQDIRPSGGAIIPGAVCALLMWMLFSALYSYYVENIANYSAIYGTLGAVIVLLIWLYLSSVVLIMGAEINHTLLAMAAGKVYRRRKEG